MRVRELLGKIGGRTGADKMAIKYAAETNFMTVKLTRYMGLSRGTFTYQAGVTFNLFEADPEGAVDQIVEGYKHRYRQWLKDPVKSNSVEKQSS